MKIKYLTFLLIQLLFSSYSLAQEKSIPEGIYKSASEFKFKRPSLPLSGKLSIDTVTIRTLNKKASVTSIQFKFDNKDIRKKEDDKIGLKIFGVSDGKDFYFSGCWDWGPGCDYSKTAFYKVLILNKRYGLCRRIFLTANGRGIDNYVIDFNNGEDEKLSKQLIKRLIKNNKPLNEQYKKEKKKGKMEVLIKYLFLFTKKGN